jgi:hypothetical protein
VTGLLITLSWVIGFANCCSAILVGPMLAALLTKLRRPLFTLRAQGLGWFVLFGGQATFWVFGFKSGFPGFIYAQPWMIPISLGNFVVWLVMVLRKQHRLNWRAETLSKGEVWDALLEARATPEWQPACDFLFTTLINDGRPAWNTAA